MTPEEIVSMTARVARSFGEDLAHEVCRVYLENRPVLREPRRWWLRTARYLRNDLKDKLNVRRAPRYWREAEWVTRRPITTPAQYAACWELVERVPAEVALQLVVLDGIRGNYSKRLAQREVLRRHAMRYARWRP
jgi:hypothetical protein